HEGEAAGGFVAFEPGELDDEGPGHDVFGDQVEAFGELAAEGAEAVSGDFYRVGYEQHQVAFGGSEALPELVGFAFTEVADEARADFRACQGGPGEAAGAAGLDQLGELVDLAPGETGCAWGTDGANHAAALDCPAEYL